MLLDTTDLNVEAAFAAALKLAESARGLTISPFAL